MFRMSPIIRFFSVFFLIALTGCAALPKEKSELPSEPPVYLDSESSHRQRVDAFLVNHSNPSEENKIQFLLDSVLASQNKFIRNGSEYPSTVAIQWLKWKRNHKQFRANPVVTAADFIHRVANQSLKTGKPYGIVLPDGRRKKLCDVLTCELSSLNDALRQRQVLEKASNLSAVKEESSSSVKSLDKVPAPIMNLSNPGRR